MIVKKLKNTTNCKAIVENVEARRIEVEVGGVSFTIEESNTKRMKITSRGGGSIAVHPCVANVVEISAEEW